MYEYPFQKRRLPDGAQGWIPVGVIEEGEDPGNPGEYLILVGDPEKSLKPDRRVTVNPPREQKPKVQPV